MIDFISILREHLPRFKKVLELSSDKGEDLKYINEYYEVVASEENKTKSRYLKDEFLDIRVIVIDNITMDTHKKVDCIFSRNVFEKYTFDEISQSLDNQTKILNENGLIFHIFDSSKIDKEKILLELEKKYTLLKCEETEDSFYTLAKLC